MRPAMVPAEQRLAAVQELIDSRRWQEAYELGLLAMDSFRNIDEGGFADALRHVAQAQLMMGCHADAEEILRGELLGCRELGEESWGTAAVALALGECLVSAPEIVHEEEAIKLAEEAQARFREMNIRQHEAYALLVATVAYAERYRKAYHDWKRFFELAHDAVSQALFIFQQLGDRRGEAEAHHSKGALLALSKDWDGALEEARAALDTYRALGMKTAEAHEQHSIAMWLSRKQGQAGEAFRVAEDALALYKHLGSSNGSTRVVNLIWQLHVDGGSWDRAMDFLRGEAQAFRKAGDLKASAECLSLMSVTEQGLGNDEEALRLAESSLALLREAGESGSVKQAAIEKAGVLLSMGKPGTALQEIPWSYDALTKRDDKVRLCFARAQSFCQLGDVKGGMEAVETLRKYFQDKGDVYGEACTWLAKAGVDAESGAQDEFVEALMSILRAKELFVIAESEEGQAVCMRMQAEISHERQEYEVAFQAAVRARTKFKGLMNERAVAECTFLIAFNLLLELHQELPKKQTKLNYTIEEVPGLIIEQALEAVEYGKRFGWSGMVAASLTILAQPYAILGKNEESLEAIAEAMQIYGEIGSTEGRATALLVQGETYSLMGDTANAKRCGNEAFVLFSKLGSSSGVERAVKFLDGARPKPAEVIKAKSDVTPLRGPAGHAAAGAARAGPARAASAPGEVLQMKRGVTVDMVSSKVRDMLHRILDADAEVDNDTPLFATGLTSNAAMLLRDDLQRELDGVKIPTTVIFDYPTIGAVSDYLVSSIK